VIFDADTLWGTTSEGGVAGQGVVFKLDPATGTFTVVHSFSAGGDGAWPMAGLTQGAPDVSRLGSRARSRVLYGTTSGGGAGKGTVFKIDTHTGIETILHSFGGPDGAEPQGALLYDGGSGQDGGAVAPALYGTTLTGGAAGYGTVFSIDPVTGAETLLYSFKGGSDGAYPAGGVVQHGDVLYGATTLGGTAQGGTLFRINIDSGREKTLYGFVGNENGGSGPMAPPMYRDGKLYGTIFGSGPPAMGSMCSGQACGSVFAVDADGGSASTLYSFVGATDGAYPAASVTIWRGVLYGTTFYGGGNWCYEQWGGCGTIFTLDPVSGVESPVYTFTGAADGENPAAGLTLRHGIFYGTTSGEDNIFGCSTGCGTIFALKP
jgi:uncharacterized repeat protein (TIGR03803 family)